jgi:hypothetical protein
MRYHYQNDYERLTVDCPPKSYKPQKIFAFRWVFEQIEDERNFQSQYEKHMKSPKPPKRYNDMGDLDKCEAMSLSMFNTLENAKKRFLFLKDEQPHPMNENAFRFLGTHIAKGEIIETDGVNQEPDRKGHFNHHPFENFNYKTRFQIIEALKI